MFIIGGIADQLTKLIWPRVSEGFFTLLPNLASHPAYQLIFSTFISPFTTNEPILWAFLSVFLSLFGSGFYNVIILLTVVLNLLCGHLLFKKYKFGLVYTGIFTFSSYFWIHLGVHIALSQIWLIALFVFLLLKFDEEGYTKRNILKLILVLTLGSLISNYIGFFLFIFLSLHALFTRKNLRYYLIILFGAFFAVGVALAPFVKTAYFSSTDDLGVNRNITRSYEDFFHFSSRPWYFLIPPVKNPWLGEYSKNVLEKIDENNYFLADDYFAAEHQGNYFGSLLLFSTAIAFVYSLRSGDKKLKTTSIKFVAMAFVVSLLMLPPFFTISGNIFWTPGQLMYKFFPMFRVTSRLGIVLLLLSLLIVAGAINSMYERMESKRKLLRLFVVLLLVVTLFETYIPLKFEKAAQEPAVYEYMHDELDKESKFMVYPFSRTEQALFLLPSHQLHIMNLREFYSGEVPADESTEALETPSGVQTAKDFGVEYILVFKDTQETLENPGILNVIYEDSETLLYEIL